MDKEVSRDGQSIFDLIETHRKALKALEAFDQGQDRQKKNDVIGAVETSAAEAILATPPVTPRGVASRARVGN